MENKKILEINGAPVFPVTVGIPAFISEHDGIRRTSKEWNVRKIPQTKIRFEIRSTYCLLHLILKGAIV